MSHTVLGGSSVGAHRQDHRNSVQTQRQTQAHSIELRTIRWRRRDSYHSEEPEDCRDIAGGVHAAMPHSRCLRFARADLWELQHTDVDRVVDLPVAARDRVSMVQTVQNAVEVQQAHYIDRIADVSYDATPSANHPDSSETTTNFRDSESPEVHGGFTGAV